MAPRKGGEETQTITCLLNIPTGDSFSSSFYIFGTQHAYLKCTDLLSFDFSDPTGRSELSGTAFSSSSREVDWLLLGR